MYTISISADDMLETYNYVSQRETAASRYKRGQCAFLREAGDGWLQKSDKSGFELIEHEFEVLLELQDSGLVPKIDEDEGIFGYPASFYIKKIDNAATVGDYCEVFLAGEISKDAFFPLMEAVGELMTAFWDLGWVHGDLNQNNIVIGMTKGGRSWRPYIIDTAFSFREEEGNLGLDRSTIETVDEDKDYFIDCLRQLDEGDESDYDKALSFIV